MPHGVEIKRYSMIILSDRKLYRHSTSRYVYKTVCCVYAVHYSYTQGDNNLETENETKQTHHRYTNSFHLDARYGIPKRTKLDDTQNNCQTDLHMKQLSNLSRTIVKLVQNNCQIATHKILCTLCLKHLSVLVQNYCQRHTFAMVKTTQVCHAQTYKIVMLNPRTN